jgi:hypothetical protein
MKETTNKKPISKEIAEAWADTELGAKIALTWLGIVFIVLIVVGIIFPIAGLIMLGIVVVLGTIGAISYLLDF